MTDEPKRTDDSEDGDDRLDLSAWEAPPPPADLADGVLARVGGTAVGPAPDQAAPRGRAWLLAGVAAAALAVTAGTYALVSGTGRAAPANGSVIAERAQALSIDTVRAELDPGARVAWQRRDGGLHVEQRAGAVTWRVDGGKRLVIACPGVAGAPGGSAEVIDVGATVASIEASGASLRVEVKMNQTDTRVIGGAALTAAAVALVTVIVYEGHVKVGGSQGQPTVIVQPGSTHTVTPPGPPPRPSPVPPTEPPVVGATAPEPTFDVDAPASPMRDQTMKVGACDAEKLKDQGMQHINMGQHAAALARFEASLRCKHDPFVIQLAFMEACASGSSPKAKLYYKKLTPPQQSKFAQVCIRQKPPVAYEDDAGDPLATSDEDDDNDNDTTVGYLQVSSRPKAKILIDGVDTGLVTPIRGKQLKLAPGKHKVTFLVGDDRFTYPVVIDAGSTQTISKDLQ